VVNHRGIVLGRDYRGTPFVSVAIARLGVDLNLRCYEEFEAETKDMTGDSTVAETEATGSTAWGSRSMSETSVFRSLGRATRSRRHRIVNSLCGLVDFWSARIRRFRSAPSEVVLFARI
jgi:hypothetical protein